jgi:hypothetical protein
MRIFLALFLGATYSCERTAETLLSPVAGSYGLNAKNATSNWSKSVDVSSLASRFSITADGRHVVRETLGGERLWTVDICDCLGWKHCADPYYFLSWRPPNTLLIEHGTPMYCAAVVQAGDGKCTYTGCN